MVKRWCLLNLGALRFKGRSGKCVLIWFGGREVAVGDTYQKFELCSRERATYGLACPETNTAVYSYMPRS